MKLQAKTGCRIHICHVSTIEEVNILRGKRGGNVSFEVAPHHLFLSEKDMERLGSFGKVNPPLRTSKDQASLWSALSSGACDILATDHAPHPMGEKETDIWSAPAGMPGVETLLPLMLNALSDRRISLGSLINLTSKNPAEIFGLKSKGQLDKGFDADLTIVDLNEKRKVRGEELQSKCGWTPYEGKLLKGWSTHTIVRGYLVFENGSFIKNKGEEVGYKR
ncbi:MAG: amidohydrolase family protein [Candidatus Altiarchaeota archaeon]